MSNELPPILILGAACVSIIHAIELANESGYQVAAAVDNLGDPLPWDHPDVPLHLLQKLPDSLRQLPAVCCIATPDYRRRVVAEAAEVGITRYISIVHPRAYVSRSTQIGVGCIIQPNTYIAAQARIGDHGLIRAFSLVGHDTVLGDYVTVAPGALIGGLVQIESGAYIGLGARILPKVRVGANSVVAAGAVVTRDVPPNTLVAGVPAVIKKRGIPGYRG